MLTKIREHAFKPLLVLSLSFLVGIAIDALAENLSAQESSSRKFNYAKKLIQEVEERDEADAPTMSDDSNEADGGVSLQQLDIGQLTKPIMSIDLNVVETADRVPEDQSARLTELNYSTNYPGTFQNRVAMWCAPNIRYQPLFFEDVGLERYGYHAGDRYQPVVSALHFAKSFTFLLPNMKKEHPYGCTYPLGFCRPGSPAPQIERRWLR